MCASLPSGKEITIASSEICREREAYHLQRASATSLPNVKAIEEKAAKIWAREALAAEQREGKKPAPAIVESAAVESSDNER